MNAAAQPQQGRLGPLEGRRTLTLRETFTFHCGPDRACFNSCCADVNIVLTPLDVLGLARRLGMTTTAFRARHTVTLETRDLQLPVVALKMEDRDGRPCPFVGPEGCTVYEDRPWACRMYPLGLAVPPAHAGEDPEPLYFLFEDDFCHGRRDGSSWTVAAWREDQGVPERERLEEAFRKVVTHPWFIGGRRLDPRRQELFLMACYDLDRFREFVFESSFLKRLVVEPELAARLATDDTALLEFAFRWVRFALFAEPTLTVRKVTNRGLG